MLNTLALVAHLVIGVMNVSIGNYGLACINGFFMLWHGVFAEGIYK